MPPDEPTDEEKLEQEPEDGQTPFRPADPQSSIVPPSDPNQLIDPATDTHDDGTIEDTHPVTDTDMDKHEMYDAGLSSAAGATDTQAKMDSDVDKPGREFDDPAGSEADNPPSDTDLPNAA